VKDFQKAPQSFNIFYARFPKHPAAGKQPKTDPVVIAAQNFNLEYGPGLAAHRVNSLFKLKKAQGAGLRNFEVDTLPFSF
jgi:hypothetical protein